MPRLGLVTLLREIKPAGLETAEGWEFQLSRGKEKAGITAPASYF